MPFYEFFCEPCYKIFTFFSKKIDVESSPNCPLCQERLNRQISSFIAAKDILNPIKDTGAYQDPKDPAFQKLLNKIQAKSKNINGDDPRAIAGLLKEINGIQGSLQNPKLSKMIDFLEKGEKGAEFDQELESVLSEIENDSEDEFGTGKKIINRFLEPEKDQEIYEM